ncbi:hypothetical protein [Laceyella tengchongensis]|uniref:hypothetical protein n=1 Tax=Laceyella tengchongensis TaxID=574699 RepID=UPI0012B71ADE|nr:hypothetical protein [Laceyella tengchongensis]
MKSFVPTLVMSECWPEPFSFVDQYGGRPWGLPEALWPSCPDCGRAMPLLAQFAHHPERIDLGREGRRVYLFLCQNEEDHCYEEHAFVFLEAEQCTGRWTERPTSASALLPSVTVVGWREKEDGISPEDYVRFFQRLEEGGKACPSLPEMETKLKGTPTFIQKPGGDAATFAGQIDCFLKVIDNIPPELWRKDQLGRSIYQSPTEGPLFMSRSKEEGIAYLDFVNFGDSGMGYFFIRPDRERPEGSFFWDCC